MMVCVVAPFDQRYCANPPVALMLEELPRQKSKSPLTAITGVGLTVNVVVAEAVHPAALVTVTVYGPDVPVVITEDVCPLDHA